MYITFLCWKTLNSFIFLTRLHETTLAMKISLKITRKKTCCNNKLIDRLTDLKKPDLL